MELKVNIQVSVDGVYQSNGGRHPDFDPGMDCVHPHPNWMRQRNITLASRTKSSQNNGSYR